MSGTSLDGVDVALVKITNKKKPIFELIGFESVPYPVSLKERILKNSKNETSSVQEICSLNVEISKEYVKAINVLLDNTKFDLSKIDFIASHGQTIWHNPNGMDGFASSTLQIGDASTISKAFNKLVVYDFRTLDMAYGGSGAPLIPISEYMIYRTNHDRVLLNIGGISNITYMKKNASIKEVFAFDTGPGNMLIDMACMKLFNLPFDDDGMIGSKGRISEELLSELMDDDYFKMLPPKSTGREKYSEAYLDKVIDKSKSLNLSNEDIISTLAAFTSKTIINQVETFVPSFNNGELIVSGGGANNSYILSLLNEYKTKQYEVKTGFSLGFNSDAKEAVGFVVLGYLRIMNKPSNVITVTGAKKEVSLGSIVLPQE
jgi:anhydro-N-acetylmuramic acid kinase